MFLRVPLERDDFGCHTLDYSAAFGGRARSQIVGGVREGDLRDDPIGTHNV
jgi:hypothetical protein